MFGIHLHKWVYIAKEEAIIIEKGKGSYLYDTNGNKYLDGYASLWVNVHGHNNKVLE